MFDWFFAKPRKRKAPETPEGQRRPDKNDNRTAPAAEEIPYPILRELIHPVVRDIMK